GILDDLVTGVQTCALPISAVQVQTSADTIHPHDDWKRARDELERKLGSHRARLAAFSTATPDSAGRENILGFGVGLRYASNAMRSEERRVGKDGGTRRLQE